MDDNKKYDWIIVIFLVKFHCKIVGLINIPL